MGLFGTDGVRGVAGEFLTAELALALGSAATTISPADAPQVLIVRDTRESGEMLEAALAAGVSSAGGHALLGGVLPTPGAALLVRRYGFDLAAVVSASHNPYQDNGIKFFGPDGTKLSDAQEDEVERLVHEHRASDAIGRVRELHGAAGDYLRELELRFSELDLSGRRILLDCAHGATYQVAPEIFRRLGADVELVAIEPDGRNINDGSGSTHVAGLAERVAAGGYEIGFAFDGDGDRVLAVDRTGAVVDGDELMALGRAPPARAGPAARRRRGRDGDDQLRLPHAPWRTPASRWPPPRWATATCWPSCCSRGWALGGEQSGHIIDTGFVPSGDGTAAALLTLEALAGRRPGRPRRDGEAAAEARERARARPRRARGAPRTSGRPWSRSHRALEGRGRVLVRPSGTEPLVRVMVEAPTPRM